MATTTISAGIFISILITTINCQIVPGWAIQDFLSYYYNPDKCEKLSYVDSSHSFRAYTNKGVPTNNSLFEHNSFPPCHIFFPPSCLPLGSHLAKTSFIQSRNGSNCLSLRMEKRINIYHTTMHATLAPNHPFMHACTIPNNHATQPIVTYLSIHDELNDKSDA